MADEKFDATAAATAGGVSNVRVRVLFFASAREAVGLEKSDLEVPCAAVSGRQLLDFLCTQWPSLRPLSAAMVLALNEDYVDMEAVTVCLKHGDELALIPPLSGG